MYIHVHEPILSCMIRNLPVLHFSKIDSQLCNQDNQGQVFANTDAVYVLCYAILMLNTDQYSSQVKKRMTLEVCKYI